MPLTYSLDLPEAGDDIDATVLSTLLINIREAISNIVGTDVAPNAGIPGSALAVGSLPGDRIANKNVAQGQLALQSVGNPEIIDGTIKKGKLATATGDQATQAQIAIFTQSVTFSPPGSGSASAFPATPVPSANYVLVGLYFSSVGVTNSTPSLRATASGGNIGCIVFNPNATMSVTVDFWYMAKT